MKTDHSTEITLLRQGRLGDRSQEPTVENQLAADLLELHDREGISLDNWASARTFCEKKIGRRVDDNYV